MDLPEDSQRIFQKNFKMSVAVTVTMDCEYPDCPTSKTGKDMAECIEQMKFHINGKHANAAAAPAASFTIKSEEKKEKTERNKCKCPVFLEQETRDEFGGNNQEFETYSSRAKLQTGEKAEDLYSACETKLKRKLRNSGVINRADLRKTVPKALLKEMERVCTPKANRLVEIELFKRLEQGEDESITNFESRVRSKAFLCDFNCCKSTCKEECLTHTKCGFSREEDEIIIQILCKMRDKDLQKKLWSENEHHEDLPKILAAIRASEAADNSQAAFGAESSSPVSIRCHKCGKWGHGKKDCRIKEEKSSSSKCGFCGGQDKCKMKKCKAYNTKCNSCNMYGHFKSCCTDFTKSRARADRDKTTISQVETDVVENNAHSIRLMTVRREEKKIRQKIRKAQDKMDANQSKRVDITNSK